MPTDQNPKQLIVERIKNASNILVTVSRSPSVDELAAALGLTLMLDKMDKVATAVFSGELPKAIEFLEPGKTFEANVDSLRDFIIALDKSKADRLRYKVEDDVVRVFITPYKTTISQDDLTFSQGDFNVDLVVALGVDKRDDLDTAITAHGRILHDAVTVTINTSPEKASLGEVDWVDTAASGFSEMLMSLSEALQPGLINEQIATAILTGLVSATDRFRNERTSPKVMTMAAQLMAAGANQQLIAEKLEEAETVSTGDLQPDTETADQAAEQPVVDGEMRVSHDDETPKEEPVVTSTVQTPAEKASNDALKEAEAELDEALARQPQPTQQLPEADSQDETSTVGEVKPGSASWRDIATPSFGGTLNATTDQAAEDKQREILNEKNRVLLSHDSPALQDAPSVPPLNAATVPSVEPTVSDIFAQPPTSFAPPSTNTSEPVVPEHEHGPDEAALSQIGVRFDTPPAPAAQAAAQDVSSPMPIVASNQTLADLDAEVGRQLAESSSPTPSVDDARAAVDAALGAELFSPASQPLESVGAQPLGNEIDHTTAAPVMTDIPAPPPPPMPALPPLPDFSTLQDIGAVTPPPAPDATVPVAPSFGVPEQPVVGQQPTAPDPGQFKLPGQ